MRAPAIDASLPNLRLDALEDEAEVAGVDLAGDLSGASAAHVELTGCRVTGARFTGARLESLRVADCVFEDCDLSGALLRRSVWLRVVLRQCRLSGAVMDQSSLKDVRLVACKLDDANLGMAVGERVEFDNCLLRGTHFHGAKLRPGAAFFDCDLTGADFSKADLRGTRLHGSTLDRIKGAESLSGVVIDLNQAIPLGLLLLAGRDIVVDDNRAPGPGTAVTG